MSGIAPSTFPLNPLATESIYLKETCNCCENVNWEGIRYHPLNLTNGVLPAPSSISLTVGEDEHEPLPLWGLGEIDLMEHNSLAGQQLLGFLAEWTAINGKDSHLTHGSNLGGNISRKYTCSSIASACGKASGKCM